MLPVFRILILKIFQRFPEYGILDDNFLLCKSRLKNFFNGKPRNNPDLFKRCNEIITDKIETRTIESVQESV